MCEYYISDVFGEFFVIQPAVMTDFCSVRLNDPDCKIILLYELPRAKDTLYLSSRPQRKRVQPGSLLLRTNVR